MGDYAKNIPFFRLLLPLMAGILWCEVAKIGIHWTVGLAGMALMLFSFFTGTRIPYPTRWIFGAGVSVFIFYIAGVSYAQHEKQTAFTFPDGETQYVGIVTDIPEEKTRSVTVQVRITHPLNKKAVLYLQQSDGAPPLQPGNRIVFAAAMQPFRNFGNPDDFNYERFMKNKGFTGSCYVPQQKWRQTGTDVLTPYIVAQQFRAQALEFYRAFRLDPHAYAFVSALTLGYKAYLPDDLRAAFRASGTSHVLAVSGLHVGIIYLIINAMLAFLGNSGRRFIFRQAIVIVILWSYVFIAGMGISVIRAAIMLSLFCVGNMAGRRGFTYNTLAAAAFLILVFRPSGLFEVGFQMSFSAVFAILYFQPKLKLLFRPKTKIGIYAADLFTVSLAAQIGVFPIVLYYFGTFPTYFFITNMLVVPLIGIVVYALFPLIVFTLLLRFDIAVFDFLYTIFQWIVKTLVDITLGIVYIAETLPFTEISDKHITLPQVVLLFVSIFASSIFLSTKRARHLMVAAIATLALTLTQTYPFIRPKPPLLAVFNHSGTSEIGLFAGNKRTLLPLPENGVVPHTRKSVIRLSDDIFRDFTAADTAFPVDVLILSQNRNFSIERLTRFLNPQLVVLDSSLPRYAASRIAAECVQQGIDVHDVSQKGAFVMEW